MGNIANITEAGRKALEVGLDGDLDAQLMMEILARVGEIDAEQLIDLAEELGEQFGSTEEALLAIKCGNVEFE